MYAYISSSLVNKFSKDVSKSVNESIIDLLHYHENEPYDNYFYIEVLVTDHNKRKEKFNIKIDRIKLNNDSNIKLENTQIPVSTDLLLIIYSYKSVNISVHTNNSIANKMSVIYTNIYQFLYSANLNYKSLSSSLSGISDLSFDEVVSIVDSMGESKWSEYIKQHSTIAKTVLRNL